MSRRWWHRFTMRQPRMWEPTGETRLLWEQGGTVRLDGEQRDRLSGKTRWRYATWITLEEREKRIDAILGEEGYR